MLRREGILGLFKGNGANCLRIAPFQSIEFYAFDQFKRLSGESTVPKLLVSGALSGVMASAVVYPLDLAKTLLAVNTH
jgi:hypothetical protein